MVCERCGARPVGEPIRLGETAPALCVVCTTAKRREGEQRALAGSPYAHDERSAALSLVEEWH